MLNNRDDDKFEVGEESEYHFSDDDISYEVETETPTPEKPEAAAPGRENIVTRLSSSKRMLISLVVFLVLVFIVYRMVMPTTNQPATIITPPVMSHQAPRVLPENAPAPVNVTAEQQPARTEVTPMNTPPAAPQVPVATTVPTQTPPFPQTTTTTTVTTPPPAPVQTTTVTPPEHMQSMPGQATMTQTTTNATGFTQVTPPGTLPSVIPVKEPTPPPALPTNMPTMPALTNQTEQMITQMNAEHKQRLEEFSAQNTMIQSQIKTLNDRVAAMEAQLNQIMQAISRPTTPTPTPPPAPVHATPIESIPEPISMHDRKLSSYIVQAIIPGRAWLRLSNGETITIAEGDPIRGLGRVSKIDPYNGVIEVNTGTKVISISYGNSS